MSGRPFGWTAPVTCGAFREAPFVFGCCQTSLVRIEARTPAYGGSFTGFSPSAGRFGPPFVTRFVGNREDTGGPHGGHGCTPGTSRPPVVPNAVFRHTRRARRSPCPARPHHRNQDQCRPPTRATRPSACAGTSEKPTSTIGEAPTAACATASATGRRGRRGLPQGGHGPPSCPPFCRLKRAVYPWPCG